MPLSTLNIPGAFPSAFGTAKPGDRVIPGRGSWMPSPDAALPPIQGGPFPLPPDPSKLPPLGPGPRPPREGRPGGGLRDKLKEIRDKIRDKLPGKKSETGGPGGRFATRDWRALDRGRAETIRSSSRQSQWALFSRNRPPLGRSNAIAPSAVNTLVTAAIRRPLVSVTTTEGIILKNGVKLGGLDPALWAKLQAAQSTLAPSNLGLRLTSGVGGNHRSGSLHYKGRAVDLTPQNKASGYDENTRQALINALNAQGLRVVDEYKNPSAKSTGGHLHVELA